MKRVFLLSMFFFLLHPCNAQVGKMKHVDFLRFVIRNYVDIKIFNEQFGDLKYESVCPYYEFDVSKIGIGDACLFAISKKYPERWVDAAKKGDCEKKHNYYGTLRCAAKELFGKDTLLLKESLDIYVFFIDIKELDGPFKEHVEGGVYENYTPKKGSLVNIFKYDLTLNEWKIIGNQINVDGEILRQIGETYVKKIATGQINDYIKHQN